MVYIGIDNGVSGSIGIIDGDTISYIKMPVKRELSYTKTKQWIHRIDSIKLIDILNIYKDKQVFASLERPMVNPTRFKATISALRAIEATLIVIEYFKFSYNYIDSKEWQKVILPAGLAGEELKIASLQIAQRLYPNLNYKGFRDGDGILIAEYLRRIKTNEKK